MLEPRPKRHLDRGMKLDLASYLELYGDATVSGAQIVALLEHRKDICGWRCKILIFYLAAKSSIQFDYIVANSLVLKQLTVIVNRQLLTTSLQAVLN